MRRVEVFLLVNLLIVLVIGITLGFPTRWWWMPVVLMVLAAAMLVLVDR